MRPSHEAPPEGRFIPLAPLGTPQHHADDIREQLAPLRLGQRGHALDDGGGGAENEALHPGRVHRAGLRLEPGGFPEP
jgi:hypothetical protein